MFCNAALCTSCYVLMEIKCAANIKRAIFGVCSLATALERLGIILDNYKYISILNARN